MSQGETTRKFADIKDIAEDALTRYNTREGEFDPSILEEIIFACNDALRDLDGFKYGRTDSVNDLQTTFGVRNA